MPNFSNFAATCVTKVVMLNAAEDGFGRAKLCEFHSFTTLDVEMLIMPPLYHLLQVSSTRIYGVKICDLKVHHADRDTRH